MPRTARAARAGWCYHVLNRANQKAEIFRGPGDFCAFVGLIVEAQLRTNLEILAACLMPNHFHLVVCPRGDRDLAQWMHWLLTTHVRRFHGRRGTNGRVWQGRYKAFPIEQDRHLLTVLRYVERNALRARLVARAEDWAWGSLGWRSGRFPGPEIAPSPVPLPEDWVAHVNRAQTAKELADLRLCAARERPFGSQGWFGTIAAQCGLETSGRGRGRPSRKGK